MNCPGLRASFNTLLEMHIAKEGCVTVRDVMELSILY